MAARGEINQVLIDLWKSLPAEGAR